MEDKYKTFILSFTLCLLLHVLALSRLQWRLEEWKSKGYISRIMPKHKYSSLGIVQRDLYPRMFFTVNYWYNAMAISEEQLY
mgnify:CR=1 FL=1